MQQSVIPQFEEHEALLASIIQAQNIEKERQDLLEYIEQYTQDYIQSQAQSVKNLEKKSKVIRADADAARSKHDEQVPPIVIDHLRQGVVNVLGDFAKIFNDGARFIHLCKRRDELSNIKQQQIKKQTQLPYPEELNYGNADREIVCKYMQCALNKLLLPDNKMDVFVDGISKPAHRFHQFKNSTMSMILAYLGIDITITNPWYHDPTLKNDNGHTVEDILKFKKVCVPVWWNVDFNVADNILLMENYLIGLEKKPIEIDQRIKYFARQFIKRQALLLNNDGDRLYQRLITYTAKNLVMISKEEFICRLVKDNTYENVKQIRDELNYTTKEEFNAFYEAYFQNKCNEFRFGGYSHESTLAMRVAKRGYAIPENSILYHDPLLMNEESEPQCVQDILQENGVIVPIWWKAD